MIFGRTKTTMIQPDAALKGRDTPIVEPGNHFVNGHSLVAPFPEGFQQIVVGLGCFWGAERVFWQTEGVWVTAVGYAGGYTPNPTYEEVCSARTGHNEVVLVVFDPSIITLEQVLAKFFEAHNPTQGMAQGNDVGTQYRSGRTGPCHRARSIHRGSWRGTAGGRSRRNRTARDLRPRW